MPHRIGTSFSVLPNRRNRCRNAPEIGVSDPKLITEVTMSPGSNPNVEGSLASVPPLSINLLLRDEPIASHGLPDPGKSLNPFADSQLHPAIFAMPP